MNNMHTHGQSSAPGRAYNTPRNIWRNRWGHSSSWGHFMEMCTVPVDVLFRRNFGQRWLTVSNFFTGLFVLLLFLGMEWELPMVLNSDPGTAVQNAIMRDILGKPLVDPYDPGIMLMPWVIALYILRGIYHFFRIFWNKRNANPRHSFDDGTSIFEPIAYGLARVLNWLTRPFIKFLMFFLPKSERRKRREPLLINNVRNLADLIVEPICLVLISFLLHGVARVWLVFSAVSVFIFTWRKIAIWRNKNLDFHDASVEARDMRTFYYGQGDDPFQAEVTFTKKATIKVKKMPPTEDSSTDYPDLNQIMEQMRNSRNKGQR